MAEIEDRFQFLRDYVKGELPLRSVTDTRRLLDAFDKAMLIVDAVTKDVSANEMYRCPFCQADVGAPFNEPHAPSCSVLMARQLKSEIEHG